MAVAAVLIYVVVTYRHSPARAKEVLIKIFTWFNGIVVGFFALVSVYAFFDNAPAVLDLSLSFMIVGLVGLLVTRIANWRFLKHNPNYRKKRLAATPAVAGRGRNKNSCREFEKRQSGGGVGIRTLDALVGHTHLAGEHLRPLGHSSA